MLKIWAWSIFGPYGKTNDLIWARRKKLTSPWSHKSHLGPNLLLLSPRWRKSSSQNLSDPSHLLSPTRQEARYNFRRDICRRPFCTFRRLICRRSPRDFWPESLVSRWFASVTVLGLAASSLRQPYRCLSSPNLFSSQFWKIAKHEPWNHRFLWFLPIRFTRVGICTWPEASI